MDLSVIICTFNRAASLDKCLAHLCRQEIPESVGFQIVVVDNNCTDNTQHVVQKYIKEYPFVVYAKEMNQGLCYARNKGVEVSSGDVIAYIDDDIYAEPTWLKAMAGIFIETGCDAAGGKIHLENSLPLPKWIGEEMYGFLGFQDLGDEVLRLDGKKKYPFGGNMAIKRTVFDKIGMFNVHIGRKGAGEKKSELFKGSETEFFHRMSGHPFKIYYQPGAVVRHRIIPSQLTKKYFLALHYNAGYQAALHDPESYQKTLLSAPLFLYSQLLTNIRKYITDTVKKGRDISFRQRMNVSYFLGRVAGYYQRAKLSTK